MFNKIANLYKAIINIFDDELNYDWEAGEFEIMVGTNSRDVEVKKIVWEK